ncbi:dihydrolipoyllysine-residue acetyltransferase component 4 of pyruvate dehydrogenase complex, chloroplastic-like [Morus notabilis]|uniref:dihydrolipoyllysine-residue acetyltransferase component 4 of pyruvate dehydrogenase complex, chloroplastic-like n=1 Tax=Morus notabilis TaxID=981085 RepID=UPI000CED3067|nr:dihydrolipoyllysine-residue acetyltransferase component 4 of pyruvate dehydrogenase complex, chloroplastic-like [Morus notabilis]
MTNACSLVGGSEIFMMAVGGGKCQMDLYLLSQKWKELVEKARSKQLQPHEYNSGMFGVDRFNTILPPGQGAIMVVGASKPAVVADVDGFFSVKSKMLVTLKDLINNAQLNFWLLQYEGYGGSKYR